MNADTEKPQNSRLGIASFILGIFLWILFIVLMIVFTQTDLLNGLFSPINGLKNDNFGLSGLLKGFFWMVVLFGIIPFAGHFTGLILGITGALQKNKKRLFPIAGIVLNGLYFVVLGLLSIVSAISRSSANHLIMCKNIFNLILTMSILTFFSAACGETTKQPEWQKAKVLAENLDHPAAIISDDLFVYYVTGGTIASLNEGTSGVWRKPLAGGEFVQLFKGHYVDKDTVILPDFFVLAIDEKYVYWSSGEIWRTPKMGGESEKITNGTPTKLVLDDEKIYWQNFIGEKGQPKPIYSCDKSGGEAKALTEPVIASGIVVDDENIFWAQSDGIYKISKNGGEKSKVYSAPEKQRLSGLIADKDNFYFTSGDGRNALFKVSKNGGEAVKITPEINHTFEFYAGETDIYFVMNEGMLETSLNKVSKNGGETVKIDSGHLRSFTIGKDSLFVTDISKIYALPK